MGMLPVSGIFDTYLKFLVIKYQKQKKISFFMQPLHNKVRLSCVFSSKFLYLKILLHEP